MFLRDLLAAFARRWWMTLFGLLLAIGAAYGGWQLTGPSYQATASLLMLPPKSTVPKEGNPFLQLDGLGTIVDLLSPAMKDQVTLESIKQTSPGAEVAITRNVNSAAPVLMISVQDANPNTALAIRNNMIELAPERLDRLQSAIGVAPNNRITSTVLVEDRTAIPVGKAQLRSAMVGGAIGLGLTAALVALIDGLLARRALRKAAPDTEADSFVADDNEPGAPSDSVGSRPVVAEGRSIGDRAGNRRDDEIEKDDEPIERILGDRPVEARI